MEFNLVKYLNNNILLLENSSAKSEINDLKALYKKVDTEIDNAVDSLMSKENMKEAVDKSIEDAGESLKDNLKTMILKLINEAEKNGKLSDKELRQKRLIEYTLGKDEITEELILKLSKGKDVTTTSLKDIPPKSDKNPVHRQMVNFNSLKKMYNHIPDAELKVIKSAGDHIITFLMNDSLYKDISIEDKQDFIRACFDENQKIDSKTFSTTSKKGKLIDLFPKTSKIVSIDEEMFNGVANYLLNQKISSINTREGSGELFFRFFVNNSTSVPNNAKKNGIKQHGDILFNDDNVCEIKSGGGTIWSFGIGNSELNKLNTKYLKTFGISNEDIKNNFSSVQRKQKDTPTKVSKEKNKDDNPISSKKEKPKQEKPIDSIKSAKQFKSWVIRDKGIGKLPVDGPVYREDVMQIWPDFFTEKFKNKIGRDWKRFDSMLSKKPNKQSLNEAKGGIVYLDISNKILKDIIIQDKNNAIIIFSDWLKDMYNPINKRSETNNITSKNDPLNGQHEKIAKNVINKIESISSYDSFKKELAKELLPYVLERYAIARQFNSLISVEPNNLTYDYVYMDDKAYLKKLELKASNISIDDGSKDGAGDIVVM
jgi:hypothetical protein